MPLTTTQIQAIIDQLYTVISSKGGIAEVMFDGRKIKYSSVEEITNALKFWEGQLARANGGRPRAMRHNLGDFN